jgi:hypothetical protein
MVLASPVTAALVFVAAAVVHLTAAAAPAAVIGLPGCNTTCGKVRVPYPLGFGDPRCYRPGFNLTCDTSRGGSQQLLLGDRSLRVTDIFVENSTVRVLRDVSMIKGAADGVTSVGVNITFASFFAGGPYRVAFSGNELVLFGCDVLARLVAGKARPGGEDGGSPGVSRCASLCDDTATSFGGNDHYCTGAGCCQVSFSSIGWYDMLTELLLGPLECVSKSGKDSLPVSVFLAQTGWLDEWGQETITRRQTDDNVSLVPKNDIPLILRWDIMKGLKLSEADERRDPYENDQGCPSDVERLCKSDNSECTWDIEVYRCQCQVGYEGNPYVDNGCQGSLIRTTLQPAS